jgi:hypothetical protein
MGRGEGNLFPEKVPFSAESSIERAADAFNNLGSTAIRVACRAKEAGEGAIAGDIFQAFV